MNGLAIGEWDLWHLGHVRFLSACRGECDHLTVAILPSDDTIHTFDERLQIVGACRYVDATWVCDDPRLLIQNQAPCLLFHGDDLAVDTIIEQLGTTEAWLDSHGVTLTLVPYLDGISTTIIKDRILGSPDAKRSWFR